MLVHRPMRTVNPRSRPVLGPMSAAALLLWLSACASGGPSRPSTASESPLKADAAAAAAVTPVCGSTTPTSCDPPPPPPPEVIPTDTKRTPLPYGWHMPSATRRDPGVSWHTAGDIVRASDATSMVMSAAPVPAAFRPEQEPATLSGLLASSSEDPEPAPTAQTVALVAPSSEASSISALIEPKPSFSIAAPVTAERKEISVPADPARATEALVAYAAMATTLTSSKSPAAAAPVEAPTAKQTTPAAIIAAAPPADAPPVAEETLDRPEWIINVATFSSPEDAKRHVDQLTAAGFKATARQEIVRGRASYRVVIESLATEAAAQSALADLSTRHGFVSAWSMRKR
ncbi:MAG: hypothetical protein K0Q76_4191 [Panacagrimonas sp.]|nr:hypothetical protein [Panacagrimonas sp.]